MKTLLDENIVHPFSLCVLVEFLLSMDFECQVSLLFLLDSGQIVLSTLLQHLFILSKGTQDSQRYLHLILTQWYFSTVLF